MNDRIAFFKEDIRERALKILDRSSVFLKTVLKDHGFDEEKSKWLFLLLLIYQEVGKPINFNGIENFSTRHQAND